MAETQAETLAKIADLVGRAEIPPDTYDDWDAAMAQRKPQRFKFAGRMWEIVEVIDTRDLALVFAATTDAEAAAAIVDFFAAHVSDGPAFRAAIAGHKVALTTLQAMVRRTLERDAGIPVEPVEGSGPLVPSPAASPPSGRTGRSSAGGSRKSASKTR